jgi:hypothetical protein
VEALASPARIHRLDVGACCARSAVTVTPMLVCSALTQRVFPATPAISIWSASEGAWVEFTVFCIASGQVKGGPATFDQPAFVLREQDGRLELKLAGPAH